MTPDTAIPIPARNCVRIKWTAPDGWGDYHVRGGLAFPQSYLVDGMQTVRGYAVVCAVNVETDRCEVVQHAPWNAVDDEIGDGGETYGTLKALAPLLARWRQQFRCGRYYWHQGDDLAQQYGRQIGRSDQIEPKPTLRRVHWAADEHVEHVLWGAAQSGRLSLPESLVETMRAQRADQQGAGAPAPAQHALLCAVVGLNRWPWNQDVPES